MPRPLRGRRRPPTATRPGHARPHTPSVPTDEALARLPELLSLESGDDALARVDALAAETPGGAPAIVEALGASRDPAAGRILTALATTAPDRDLRKSARRALHRLRSAGIAVEVPVAADLDQSPARPGADVLSPSRALVSAIDGTGSRLMWLLYERRSGGLLLFNLILNDQSGLQDAVISDTTIRRFTQETNAWSQRSGLQPVEIPFEYGLSLVAEALALNAESGTTVPHDFVMRRGLLGELPPPPAAALIHQHISRGQAFLVPTLLDTSAQLLQERELQSWLFDYAEVSEHARQLRQAEESRLILTNEPPEARRQRIIGTAIDQLFTP